jgi:hypothetical protein
MNPIVKFGTAAAAVLVVAVVAWQLLPGRGGVGSEPTPSPSPTTATTPGATQAADPLIGWWVSEPSTCADQNAALQKAGFTAAQLDLGRWDAATCSDISFGGAPLTHGSVHRIRFMQAVVVPIPTGTSPSGTIIQYADGDVGWEGYYVLVDGGTFMAGDGARLPYLTYTFTIDGDQLVIDMVDNQFPAPTEADLWSDTIAQTVIYESGPFTREP